MAKIARLPLGRIGIAFIVLGLLSGILVFQTPGQTKPPTIPPDSDGKVPLKKACYHENSRESWLDLYRIPRGDGTEEIRTVITIDLCELRDLGAGSQDIKNFIKHERSHSKGFNHYEGTPETNPAYYPQIVITGR